MNPQFDGLLFAINLLTVAVGFGLAVAPPPPRDPFVEIERVLVPLEREIAARTEVAQVVVQPHPDQAQRVDLFAPDGRRTGYAVVDPRTGRVDTYNVHGQRTGYGTISGSRIDFYDNSSNRVGSGRLGK